MIKDSGDQQRMDSNTQYSCIGKVISLGADWIK